MSIGHWRYYRNGDLIVDFNQHIFFIYTGQPIVEKNAKFRVATPGEAKIFNDNFFKKGKHQATFEEFKNFMPAFDGRKLNDVIYETLNLTESEYLFFRELKVEYHGKLYISATYDDKINFLISKYLEAKQHNIFDNKKESKELKNLRKMKSLLSELMHVVQND